MISAALQQLHRLLNSVFGAALGAACYGLWATYANWSAGSGAATRIGLTHFAMSLGLTLIGVRLMNRLFERARDPRLGALLAFCGSMSVTYVLLVGVHLAIGTPHILLTLTPGFLPTIGFCVAYSLLLLRRARQLPVPAAHAFASQLR